MSRYGCADGELVHTLGKIEARLYRRPASPSRMEFSEDRDVEPDGIGEDRRCPLRVTCGRRLGKSLFDVAAALVECGHVSGLLMRPSDRWP